MKNIKPKKIILVTMAIILTSPLWLSILAFTTYMALLWVAHDFAPDFLIRDRCLDNPDSSQEFLQQCKELMGWKE